MKFMLKMAVSSVVLLAGCATGTGGWEVSLKEGYAEKQVLRVDDEDFAEILVVERTRIRRVSSGFAVAEVDVRNAEDADFAFQYRFVFFDADGYPIRPEARAWEQDDLHGGESRQLIATAPTADAVGFVVRARRIK